MKLAVLIIIAILLAGCAHQSDNAYAKYADCAMPVTRNAGMGVQVPGCEFQVFGPNKLQAYRFQHRTGVGSWLER